MVSLDARYSAQVFGRLCEAFRRLLNRAEFRDRAMELICSLVDKIELTPKEGAGHGSILHGDLARILALCSTGAQEAKPVCAIRVAGSGYDKTLAGPAMRGFCVCGVWLRGQDLNL